VFEDGTVQDVVWWCRTTLFCSETRERNVLDPTYCKKPISKFTLWERTCGLQNQDKSATPIIGEESWALMLVISCTSRCQLWKVYAISRYEASSHIDSFDHSRLRRREVRWCINWNCHHNCQMWRICSMSLNLKSVVCAWAANTHERLEC
jgi:hypothetical protein